MSHALRVAIIAASRHPIAQPFAGGLESHVWHLARALTDAGHRVTLFAAPGSDPAVHDDDLAVQTFEPSSVAALDVSMAPREFLVDHHAYLAVMLELAASTCFDVVHNHSLHYLPVAMAPMLPVPMLMTLHTPPTPWLESAFMVGHAANTRCVAVSEHTAASWRHAVPDVRVVHNGVDLGCWPEGAGGPDVIWFGRFVAEKGPHLAIAAARKAGVRLRLAGPVSDLHYFRSHIQPCLGAGVDYIGHLDQRRLAAAVGASAATVVTPIWDEPYGLVVAESLACGTPVAAFDRGGIPEVLGPDAGVLAAPGDIDDLAAAIGRAVHIPRRVARRRAESTCSARAMVGRYLDLYADLVAPAALAVR